MGSTCPAGGSVSARPSPPGATAGGSIRYRIPLIVLLVAAASAPAVRAQRPLPDLVVRSGTLSFDARATLGDFTGVTSTVTGRMTGGGGLAEVRGWVEAPAASLVTGNGRRDKDLNKSMETDRYPAMRFELEGVEVASETPDSAAVILRGRLTLHGVTRAVALPARVGFTGEGLRLLSDFPLNVKDYEVGGLTKMLGMLRMHPEIVVHVDLVFGPGAAAGPPAAAPGATSPARD